MRDVKIMGFTKCNENVVFSPDLHSSPVYILTVNPKIIFREDKV